MNPFELMELMKIKFTNKEMLIYEYIKDNADQVIRASITSLAEKIKVSQPTITRFCKKLGFDGYNKFMLALYAYQKQELTSINDSKYNFKLIDSYIKLIEKLDILLEPEVLKKIADIIINSKTVLTLGCHKSKLSAELLRYNLIKFGINCSSFNTDDSQEITYLTSKDKNNVIVVFSVEGESVLDSLKLLNKEDIHVILVTMNAKTVAKKYSDELIWLPNSRNQSLKQYTENSVVFSVFIDIITSYIANRI